MTLCVGWIDSDAVYLTADSAVTALGKTRIAGRDYSSFGEKQYQSPQGNVTVEESALKIFRHQNTAAAFAGDASPINGIFANFVESSRFLLPQEAFDAAWMSSHDSQHDLAALFGYHDITGPHLKKYNSFKVAGDETTSACVGNLTAEDKGKICEFLLEMPAQASVTDRLVCTVCMTQRFGVFSNLMETHGIGGFVAGCSITENGFRWAPDTLHVILRGDLTDQLSTDILNVVLTCERFDTFFVCNTLMNGGYEGFTNRFGMNFGLGPKEVVQNILAQKQCLPPISTELKVDYIVFYDVVTELSTIFNVRAGDHPNLKYWLTRDDPTGPLIVRFTASGNGLGALNRPSSGEGGNIAFVPY